MSGLIHHHHAPSSPSFTSIFLFLVKFTRYSRELVSLVEEVGSVMLWSVRCGLCVGKGG
ncbi:hypothetical protein Hanom_Chr05g00458531 [Helianthus anomalus]